MTGVVKTVDECFTCGGHMHVSAGQVASDARLRYFRSFRCESCGFQVEEDGSGIEPELHGLLLAKDGEFLLRVTLETDVAQIRQLLEVDFQEVVALRTIHPQCVARGTKIEMEWLRQSLAALEIAAEYYPIPDSSNI